MSQTTRVRKKPTIHACPKLYVCYLLRSIPRPNSFYIGSTPDPVRRLRQHNGELAAGAYKTKRKGYRPWEMVMVVHGFPNKISALQFEHAWQHSYQTRHIQKTNRITTSKISGRSLAHKLGNVRLLLNSDFFYNMNLQVHIFNSETYQTWYKDKFGIRLNNELVLVDHYDAEKSDDTINMENVVDFKKKRVEQDMLVLQKFKDILRKRVHNCPLCLDDIDYGEDSSIPLAALCYHEDCEHLSHLKCLGSDFKIQASEKLLASQATQASQTSQKKQKETTESNIGSKLIPRKGTCPSCCKALVWTTIVRYSTLNRLLIGSDGKLPHIEEEEEDDDEPLDDAKIQ